MKPTIVIPNYIATDELKELATNTINSMRETADVHIISVDDGSPLDTRFLFKLSDEVILIEKNCGFAVACNIGLKQAMRRRGAHYIGCANNDIEVFPNWLEALVEPFSKWDNVGITGLVSTKDRAEAERHKGTKITEGGLLGDRMQSGGLWMSTRSVLQKVGLFDEQFEVGGEEDVDLFLRMRDQYEMHIIMSDRAMFWHKEGATRWNEELAGFKERNKAAEQVNYDKFAAKWGFDIRSQGLNFYEHVLEG